MRVLICLFLLSIAPRASAAVVINEIAWMGSAVSANDEWVELYNNGDAAVSIDGWVLSDGVNFEVGLAGTVGAGDYAVLERTDDDSVAGAAFLIYTGSLSNAGATLSLYRADSSIADRVVGGEDWSNIGGDNTTKETAQYTDLGWQTGSPTPGYTNITEGADHHEETSETQESSTVVSKKKDAPSIPSLHFVQRELHTEIHAPQQVYENQQVVFTIDPEGIADGLLQSLKHEWNFGDGNIATGASVSHRYEYPGSYVITVHSSYKAYESTTRKNITVLPVSFSLTTDQEGNIQIHNDARYEVDLSGYTLEGGVSFTFPPRTILLPNGTITLPVERIRDTPGANVSLADEQDALIASLYTPADTYVSPEVAVSTRAPQTLPVVAAEVSTVHASQGSASFSFPADDAKDTGSEARVTKEIEDTRQAATVIESTKSLPIDTPTNIWVYFALVGIIGIGMLGIFAGRIR